MMMMRYALESSGGSGHTFPSNQTSAFQDLKEHLELGIISVKSTTQKEVDKLSHVVSDPFKVAVMHIV